MMTSLGDLIGAQWIGQDLRPHLCPGGATPTAAPLPGVYDDRSCRFKCKLPEPWGAVVSEPVEE